MKLVSLPKSPIDVQIKLMWRPLRLAFWLAAGTALLYMLANFQRGRLALALVDGVALGVLALGYRVSICLGRPEVGLQAIAIIAWLTVAITITMHGGLRSPAIAWIVVLAPLQGERCRTQGAHRADRDRASDPSLARGNAQ